MLFRRAQSSGLQPGASATFFRGLGELSFCGGVVSGARRPPIAVLVFDPRGGCSDGPEVAGTSKLGLAWRCALFIAGNAGGVSSSLSDTLGTLGGAIRSLSCSSFTSGTSCAVSPKSALPAARAASIRRSQHVSGGEKHVPPSEGAPCLFFVGLVPRWTTPCVS